MAGCATWSRGSQGQRSKATAMIAKPALWKYSADVRPQRAQTKRPRHSGLPDPQEPLAAGGNARAQARERSSRGTSPAGRALDKGVTGPPSRRGAGHMAQRDDRRRTAEDASPQRIHLHWVRRPCQPKDEVQAAPHQGGASNGATARNARVHAGKTRSAGGTRSANMTLLGSSKWSGAPKDSGVPAEVAIGVGQPIRTQAPRQTRRAKTTPRGPHAPRRGAGADCGIAGARP